MPDQTSFALQADVARYQAPLSIPLLPSRHDLQLASTVPLTKRTISSRHTFSWRREAMIPPTIATIASQFVIDKIDAPLRLPIEHPPAKLAPNPISVPPKILASA